MFKVANGMNIGYESISMSHNLKHRTTRAFLHGLIDDEIGRLIKYLQTRKDKSIYELPLLLPTRIFQGYRAKTEAYRVDIDDSLQMTEVQIGYAIPGVLRGRPERNRSFREVRLKVEGLEFDNIARMLHSCSTELGNVLHSANFGKELGSFLCKVALELEDMLKETDTRRLIDARALMHSIEFSVNLYMSLLSQATILKDRVQNHIDLVSYTSGSILCNC